MAATAAIYSGGGRGGVSGYINQTLASFQAASQAAKAANLQRYNQILGGYNELASEHIQKLEGIPQEYRDIAAAYTQRTQDLSSKLEGFGDVQRKDLSDLYAQRQAAAQRDIARRGMYNTGVLEDQMRGLTKDQAIEQARLGDLLTRQQMDYMAGLTGQELAARAQIPAAMMAASGQQFQYGQQPLLFMERRSDTGPTTGDVQSFATAAGPGLAPVVDYAGAVRSQGMMTPGRFGGAGGPSMGSRPSWYSGYRYTGAGGG